MSRDVERLAQLFPEGRAAHELAKGRELRRFLSLYFGALVLCGAVILAVRGCLP